MHFYKLSALVAAALATSATAEPVMKHNVKRGYGHTTTTTTTTKHTTTTTPCKTTTKPSTTTTTTPFKTTTKSTTTTTTTPCKTTTKSTTTTTTTPCKTTTKSTTTTTPCKTTTKATTTTTTTTASPTPTIVVNANCSVTANSTQALDVQTLIDINNAFIALNSSDTIIDIQGRIDRANANGLDFSYVVFNTARQLAQDAASGSSGSVAANLTQVECDLAAYPPGSCQSNLQQFIPQLQSTINTLLPPSIDFSTFDYTTVNGSDPANLPLFNGTAVINNLNSTLGGLQVLATLLGQCDPAATVAFNTACQASVKADAQSS